jgi:hypothetical protein
MTRRALFASLAAAFVLDPERLLWKPGAKLISVPANAPSPALWGCPSPFSPVTVQGVFFWTAKGGPVIQIWPEPRPGDRFTIASINAVNPRVGYVYDDPLKAA